MFISPTLSSSMVPKFSALSSCYSCDSNKTPSQPLSLKHPLWEGTEEGLPVLLPRDPGIPSAIPIWSHVVKTSQETWSWLPAAVTQAPLLCRVVSAEMPFDQHKGRLLPPYVEQQSFLSWHFRFNFTEPKAQEERMKSSLVLGPRWEPPSQGRMLNCPPSHSYNYKISV